MHIAICDDNVADRKQLERLLQREADEKPSDSSGFYVDSYGNHDALLSAPMTYDVYFIDMTSSDKNGVELTWELRKSGVNSPIILCSGAIYYPSFRNLPHPIYFLDKPIKVNELKEKLNLAKDINKQAVKKLKIQCEKTTAYIVANEITFVTPQNHLSIIHLCDGTTLDMFGTLDDFYYLTEKEQKFIFAKKKLLVNSDYISSLSITKLTLKDGTSFHINFGDWNFIKKFWPAK